jgi:hypothetical protein
MCLVWEIRWSIIFSFFTFCIWFMKWNELIYHHLIPHKLIISILIRNELIPPKFIGWTHDMHHLMKHGVMVIPQTKHTISSLLYA